VYTACENDAARNPLPESPLNALRLLPVALALGLLAAHFYRSALWVPLGLAVGLLPVLFIRAPWAARALQVALLAGALEWMRTAAALIALRLSMGMPWMRLALILGAVALATALCTLVFQTTAVRRRFGLVKDP
jgi:hypothetical protein